jgi:hypothetical protein
MPSPLDQKEFLEHGRFGDGNLSLIRPSIWKAGVLVGVCLIVIGVSAGYVDVATHFRFSFLSTNYGIFIGALFAGLVLSFVATIGWARGFTKNGRLRTAGLVFVLPWLGMLLADQVEHFNVHGPSVFLYYFVLPVALLLAIVLLFISWLPDQYKDLESQQRGSTHS